jgi:hypothetical protein
MAVSTTHERVLYDLDGVTAGYSVTFQFFAEGDLSVTYGTTGDETTLSLGSDYTVAARPSDLPALGTITLASPGRSPGSCRSGGARPARRASTSPRPARRTRRRTRTRWTGRC